MTEKVIPTDLMLKELGRLYMENVELRQSLEDEQQETARMATVVGTVRQRHKKLSATAIQQEKDLIALNERLMGKKGPRPLDSEPAP